MMRLLTGAIALLMLAAGQDGKKGPPDDIKVGEAIRKGVEYLKTKAGSTGDGRDSKLELVLLTMVHAGVKTNDPVFADLFKKMLDQKPEFTYRTALRAMVLEEVQRVKYQPQIYHCAQFLVDNQSKEGHWGYGKPTELEDISPVKDVATSGVKVYDDGPGPKEKPKVIRKVPVKKKKDEGGGDNSNSQYAALGLRACHDAGIIIPEEVTNRAIKWWRDKQEDAGKDDKAVATGTGLSGEPLGWDYNAGKKAYGSMTVGAVGALSIYIYIQGKNWKQDKDLAEGAAWIAKNFSVTTNPKRDDKKWHYYYLYGLERAGVLYDTEKFGAREWYPEGAWYLLEHQHAKGFWNESDGDFKKGTGDVTDTCFAILFLKRATRPLVASEAAGGRR